MPISPQPQVEDKVSGSEPCAGVFPQAAGTELPTDALCERMFVRHRDEIAQVLRLSEAGLGASAVARQTGIPRSTVRTWVSGRLPQPRPDLGRSTRTYCQTTTRTSSVCIFGDGHISPGPRAVYRLRLFLDAKYPQIIAEATAAIQACVPHNRVSEIRRRSSYTDSSDLTTVTVYSYSKRWPALFPQHGPGKKHERPIELADWQQRLVDANPRGFAAWLDPFGWVPRDEHRHELASSALQLLQPVRRHPQDLREGVRSGRRPLHSSEARPLRLAQSRRGNPRHVHRSEALERSALDPKLRRERPGARSWPGHGCRW